MRCIPLLNRPVKIYKSPGKLLPPICIRRLWAFFFFFFPPILSSCEIHRDKSSAVTRWTLQLTEGGNEDRGAADMVTLMKRSTKALDHCNLEEIDYPINIWHDGELLMFGAALTRCNCPGHVFSTHYATPCQLERLCARGSTAFNILYKWIFILYKSVIM